MKLGRFGVVATFVLALTSATSWTTAAARQGRDTQALVERCQVAESELAELSGLASDGASWYAIADGGRTVKVFVLDPHTCSIRQTRTAPINPYDVEDLALDRFGTAWLADIGDNDRQRETVALHAVPAAGGEKTYRLSYPDGPHDAEALLLDQKGVPYIVTKEPFGTAGVYRPSAGLVANKTVPLERVGSLPLGPTGSRGGPFSDAMSSVLVTGAATRRDGELVAIRTYTDVYLYRAPRGDVARALREEPLRLALPYEPQGEAIAFEPDGTLLSASEGQEPVYALSNVEERAVPAGESHSGKPPAIHPVPTTEADGSSGAREASGTSTTVTLIVAGIVATLLIAMVRRFRGGSR